LATQLRHQTPRVLDPPLGEFSQTSPSRLAGYCYNISEAYYHGVDADVRNRLTPKQLELIVEDQHFDGQISVSHWFLERDDGVIIDLTAEQFDFLTDPVPYEDATGRGFVPPSPSGHTQEVLEVVDT
jgi:hypothetical protein